MTVAVDHACTLHPVPLRSCYVRCGCNCDGCRADNARQERRRYAARGGHPDHPRKVDATPVRVRVGQLRTAGWSYRKIAAVSGVPAATLSSLMRHRWETVRKATADAVLAIEVPAVRGEVVRAGCVDCGAVPFAGGLRCWPCFQATADPRPAPTWDSRCGTRRGYGRHDRLGERPCEPCKASRRVVRDVVKETA